MSASWFVIGSMLYVLGGVGTSLLELVLTYESKWERCAIWPITLPVMLVAIVWRGIKGLGDLF